MRIIRSEFLKIFTLRTWWVLIIIMVGYVGVTAAILGGGIMLADNLTGGTLSSGIGTQGVQMAYATALSVGYVFPLLVGALSISGEYRFSTIIPTFLLTPKRSSVLGAKLLTQFVMGLIYGALAFIAAVLASVFFFIAAGHDTGFSDFETWAIIIRGTFAMAIWAMIGVGLGVLVRNQTAVIIIAIGFTQFLEPILRVLALFNDVTANIGKFLPGAASEALCGVSMYSQISLGADSLGGLPWWAGALVLLGYAALTALIGYWTRWTKDTA